VAWYVPGKQAEHARPRAVANKLCALGQTLENASHVNAPVREILPSMDRMGDREAVPDSVHGGYKIFKEIAVVRNSATASTWKLLGMLEASSSIFRGL
jgi:hypothetical protein